MLKRESDLTLYGFGLVREGFKEPAIVKANGEG
jgi:hypothetical protein